MFWAVLSTIGGVFAVLLWLRRLTPDSIDLAVADTRKDTGSRSTGRSQGTVSARTADSPVIASARTRGLKSAALPFAALSIKPGENACIGAADMRPVRFLQEAAPHLPLQGCDRFACNCTFVRYQDRRTNEQGERRDPDYGATAPRADTPVALRDDRRLLHGRRITDQS